MLIMLFCFEFVDDDFGPFRVGILVLVCNELGSLGCNFSDELYTRSKKGQINDCKSDLEF